MEQVSKRELVDALRGFSKAEDLRSIADRVEKYGIAPPDGWVVVPEEPTKEMFRAIHWKFVREGYKVILAAAQEVSNEP